MRISTLHSEFTNDLESFAKTPIQIQCLNEWNPKKVAAPERHLFLGRSRAETLDIQMYTLENENEAFDNISSLLRIYLDRKILRSLTKIDPVREQVWLFAQKWFSVYYEALTEPDILKSEFFRNYNDDFLILLGSMLEVNPKKRISFLQALQVWHPGSDLFKKVESEDESDHEDEREQGQEQKQPKEPEQEQEQEQPKESTHQLNEGLHVPITDIMLPVAISQTASLQSSSVSSPQPLPSSSKPSSTRLVLNGFRRIEEHNRTRKNPRN